MTTDQRRADLDYQWDFDFLTKPLPFVELQPVKEAKLCNGCHTFTSGSTKATKHSMPIEPIVRSFNSFEDGAIEGCIICFSYLNLLPSESLGELRKHNSMNMYALSDWKDTVEGFSRDPITRKPVPNRLQLSMVVILYQWIREELPAALQEVLHEDSEAFFVRDIHIKPSPGYLFGNKDNRGFLLRTEGTKDFQTEQFQFTSTNNSRESVWLHNHWLKQCETTHTNCKPRAPATFKPTRLIFLGSDDGIICPQLISGVDIERVVVYGTLSHCWGPDKFFTLIKDNLVKMHKHIDCSKLQRTFKEAMETARRMNIYYIWIDSLCIIQDDPEDWKTESTLMGEIYHHAVINIAATRARSGTDGLYATRKPEQIGVQNIPIAWSNCSGNTYQLLPWGIWKHNVDQTPLLSRAWVTQEVILSRRNLHFCDSQLYWDCSQMRASESYPNGMKSAESRISITNMHKSIRSTDLLTIDEQELRYGAWQAILKAYTAATLSYPGKDKLQAVSTMARLFAPGNRFIAGLWIDRLATELLWETTDQTTVASEYQAPSWSWASRNGPIATQITLSNFHRTQQSAKYELTGQDNTEGVESSIIRLSDIKTFHENDDPREPLIGGYLKIWGGIWKIPVPEVVDGLFVRVADWQVWISQDDRRLGSVMYLLATLTSTIWSPTIHGILLHPTGVKGEYRRTGYFWTKWNPPVEEGKSFMQYCHRYLMEDVEEYEEFDETAYLRKHLVKII